MLTAVLIELVPALNSWATEIFTIMMSLSGALVVKFLFTDAASIFAQIVQIVVEDRQITIDDVMSVLEELYGDTSVDTQTVKKVEEKFSEKGLVKKKEMGDVSTNQQLATDHPVG